MLRTATIIEEKRRQHGCHDHYKINKKRFLLKRLQIISSLAFTLSCPDLRVINGSATFLQGFEFKFIILASVDVTEAGPKETFVPFTRVEAFCPKVPV